MIITYMLMMLVLSPISYSSDDEDNVDVYVDKDGVTNIVQRKTPEEEATKGTLDVYVDEDGVTNFIYHKTAEEIEEEKRVEEAQRKLQEKLDELERRKRAEEAEERDKALIDIRRRILDGSYASRGFSRLIDFVYMSNDELLECYRNNDRDRGLLLDFRIYLPWYQQKILDDEDKVRMGK